MLTAAKLVKIWSLFQHSDFSLVFICLTRWRWIHSGHGKNSCVWGWERTCFLKYTSIVFPISPFVVTSTANAITWSSYLHLCHGNSQETRRKSDKCELRREGNCNGSCEMWTTSTYRLLSVV